MHLAEVGTTPGVTVAVTVVPHAGKSCLLATDGFLVDGFMHLAEVGTASGVAVAVTVVPHAGKSCLLATDGFLIDGFMHVAEVGTTPEMAVAVTVVPHAGKSCLLVGGLVLGAVVGAFFGVPLAVAVLASSHRPRLPARYDEPAVGATWIGPTLRYLCPPGGAPNLLAMAF
jgi:hypothetical protein